jgi:diaminopimelate epimerase
VASAPVNDPALVKGTHFYKMTGSGNDFVVLDGRQTQLTAWPPHLIRAICNRRTGVGADGLVILSPLSRSAARMSYWNADGSLAAMCGNAALCCGTLAVHLGWTPGGEFCLLTDMGPVGVRVQSGSPTAEIKLPDFDAPVPFSAVPPGPGEQWISRVEVGVPHLVVRVGAIESVDLASRGRFLRYHPELGPAGANVNFVGPGRAGDGPWLIRTYERGVEAETLACGTGTVAAAVALARRGEAVLPIRFRSRGGQPLSVQAALAGKRATEVWLGGEGRLVFTGVWEDATAS